MQPNEKSCCMKQCIKYLILFLLGVLLYDTAAQATGISCLSTNNDTEGYFFSQAPTTQQQVTRNIYNHFSSVTLYMDDIDSMQVPSDKSMLLLLNYIRTYWLADSPVCNSSLCIYSPPVSDPISYYVFGLRKIII